jgi:hypothetical protein
MLLATVPRFRVNIFISDHAVGRTFNIIIDWRNTKIQRLTSRQRGGGQTRARCAVRVILEY